MNPSPAELWLRDQALRFNETIPVGPVQDAWLPDPRLLPPCVNNPVHRPPGVRFPEWFDVRHTATGAAVASSLGASSGYFQEYASWAPFVSWIFDLTAAWIHVTAHPAFPPVLRDVNLPYLHALVTCVERLDASLRLHQVHADQKGTLLDGTWRALQSNLRLGGASRRFSTAFIDEPLAKLRTDALGHQLKLASKTAGAKANRAATGDPKPQGTGQPGHSGGKPWKGGPKARPSGGAGASTPP